MIGIKDECCFRIANDCIPSLSELNINFVNDSCADNKLFLLERPVNSEVDTHILQVSYYSLAASHNYA